MLIETNVNDMLRLREKNEKSSGSARSGGDRARTQRDCQGGKAVRPRSPVLAALIKILSQMGQRWF